VPAPATCPLCTTRRAKRQCPAKQCAICTLCCAEQRERTIDCDPTCVHLRESRAHEQLIAVDEANLPNRDIVVTEDDIKRWEFLVLMLGACVARAMKEFNAVDADAREALATMIQDRRAADSGLVYEATIANPNAAKIHSAVRTIIGQIQQRIAEVTGAPKVPTTDLIGTLVFLERLGLQRNNGRPRGRTFYHFLETFFPDAKPEVPTT
jgi:hypothetical protein